jgi:hypothetical protein
MFYIKKKYDLWYLFLAYYYNHYLYNYLQTVQLSYFLSTNYL